jgi:F0F1-type ATP synthase delta subunit
MPREYAQALFETIQSAQGAKETTAFVDRLVELLKCAGKVKLLPSILREYERLENKHKHERPVLTIARNSDATSAKKTAHEQFKDVLSDDALVQVDDTLIGGWRLSSRNVLVDRSYKAALLKLYRSIVSA